MNRWLGIGVEGRKRFNSYVMNEDQNMNLGIQV